MSDFREELTIQRDGQNDFAYCWAKTDMATEELVDCDYEQSCSFEEVMKAVAVHQFDSFKVYNHFAEGSQETLVLTDEY